MTPRLFETALMPASFPGVSFMMRTFLRRGAPGMNEFELDPQKQLGHGCRTEHSN
jgi:hypothetical protein